MKKALFFNLFPFNDYIFLPNAYLAQTDDAGNLTHVEQKTFLTVVASHGIQVGELERQLFDIIDKLQPKVLEEKYKSPKSKTSVSLDKLLSQQDIKPVLERHIYGLLDQFLEMISRNRLPLTLDIARKSLVADHLLTFAADELVPHIFFKKTQNGIEYQLQIGTEIEKWSIAARQPTILTNTLPAWIVVEHQIFRLQGINGNMLKPFLSKNVVTVPQNNVREYIQKIVVKSAQRTQIEAEGFEMCIEKSLEQAVLKLQQDFLQKNWMLHLDFIYSRGQTFPFFDKKQKKTGVEFPDDASFVVWQVQRDHSQEQLLLRFLEKCGLKIVGRALHFPENFTFQQAVAWLTEHRQTIENQGIIVDLPCFSDKKIALLSGDISVQSHAKTDWFDVEGVVRIGTMWELPFRKFVPFLKRGETLFPLPDGTYFQIPEAWFARFSELAASLIEQGDVLRLPKTLYTLLESSDVMPLENSPILNTQSVEFQLPVQFRASLRPYQLDGVRWLIGHHLQGFGACLADDMGLGKTLQTIAVLMWARAQKNAVLSQKSAEKLPVTTSSTTKTVSNKGKKPAIKAFVGLQLDLFATPPPLADVQVETRFQQNLEENSQHNVPSKFCALIIVPASLVFNWWAEFEKFTEGLFKYRHIGNGRHTDPRLLAAHDVVLTTYHTARQDLELLQAVEWSYIVLDESQWIKNRTSEISKMVRSLRAEHKISLSGTPIENSLADLWSQMEFINPATLGSFEQFRRQFMLPIERSGDKIAKMQLLRRVQPYFLRRTKQEVAPDLPALDEQVFISEMLPEQKSLYERVKSAMRNQILALFDAPHGKIEALQALTRLRQIANHPLLLPEDFPFLNDEKTALDCDSGKFNDVLAQWQTVQRSGHKVLIFSSFEKHLQLFRQYFEAEKVPFAWLTGSVDAKHRQREVERFQSETAVQVMMMTMKAGGVGLNLTAADYVFVLDPWWNPAVESQAISRAHRIGLEHPLTAIRFITAESVEEKIRQLQLQKAQISAQLFEKLDEKEWFFQLEREDLEILLA